MFETIAGPIILLIVILVIVFRLWNLDDRVRALESALSQQQEGKDR